MAKKVRKAAAKVVDAGAAVIEKVEPIVEVAATVDPRAKKVKRAIALLRRVFRGRR